MSTQLSPIHYWMFSKIKIQDQITGEILLLNSKNNFVDNLNELVDSTCGVVENGQLDDIIDLEDIHGWIQERVAIVEKRFAFTVTNILDKKQDSMNDISNIVFELGKIYGDRNSENLCSLEKCFNFIGSCTLDGMPCDNINVLVSSDESNIIWKRTQCIHENYWLEFDGDIKNYYKLRESFIKGILFSTKFDYKNNEDESYMLYVK